MYSKNFLNQGKSTAILEGFREWLALQNYEKTTVKYGPKRIGEFMAYCTREKIEQDHARLFFEHLKRRKHKKESKGLSSNYLRIYIRILRLFRRFLVEVYKVDLEVNIIFREQSLRYPEIFSKAEIEELYKVINDDVLGMRDRAMLAIYYGCGLRREEGASLLVEDIVRSQELVFVRKGKNYKQRYVPLIGQSKIDVLTYIRIGRPVLLREKSHLDLFISYRGAVLKSSGLYERLKSLIKKAGIDKPCGLHSLRHSIATHLLSNGMPLKQIGKLLGHASLDTTQIYTHMVNEMKSDE